MPALNFQSRFADKVERGETWQTIRKGIRFKVGDKVYLYTGMRTKQCRKLGEGVCTAAERIQIGERSVFVFHKWLTMIEQYALARKDGFESQDGLFDFFRSTYGLPFDGQLIRWCLVQQRRDGKAAVNAAPV